MEKFKEKYQCKFIVDDFGGKNVVFYPVADEKKKDEKQSGNPQKGKIVFSIRNLETVEFEAGKNYMIEITETK